MNIKLFPSVPVILLVFQLAHIWFRGEVYFSWWWVVIILAFWTILATLADKLSDALKHYADSHATKLDNKLNELDDKTKRMNRGNNMVLDDVVELKKKAIDFEQRLRYVERR